jgi:hypothetical protein
MSKVLKFNLSPSGILLRLLIAAVFLFGFMPAPALAVENGTISGQVTDSTSSNPISGATILVFASGSQTPGWNGNSDAGGNYSIEVPEGSNYQLSAIKEGYITGNSGSQDVTANETTTVNFPLAPGGIIQGTITDNASNPVQDANVLAYLPATPNTFYSSQPADASGHYSLTVPAGTGYTVEADKEGVGIWRMTARSKAS